ncbi:MAG: C39 family peptidase [Prosthecobacter sp.]|uniref:C39 family peptidase n=1 Tax=Prosthecobacter sp. TaxID=1965333 RepID=UPI0025E95834|nr:C39 family peptidase [Prosthecobacter sp.]MCF7787188.1 C39 family peptidase [Prosthecobacter sp.]
MQPAANVFLVLGLSLAAAFSQTSEFRTYTNTQGKAVQAKLVGVDGPNVTLELAGGQKYTFAITSLSAADQQYIKSAAVPAAAPTAKYTFKPGPNDKLEPASVNESVGQPLFGDAPLWTSSAEEIAAKLKIPQESKTKTSSSYRAYTKDDYQMFGAHPYSVAMYAENDQVTNFSLVFANKGDLFSAKGSGEMHFDKDTPPAEAAKIVKTAMDKDLVAIAAALTQKLGEPKKERFGEGSNKIGRMTVQRWDWRGHSILLAEAPGEYVGVQIVTTAFADAGGKVEDLTDKVIRAQALANLEKRPNGDVVIGEIPMVDQGPKGYCAPATAERAMRYLGVPADMYILANAGETGFGGGTSISTLLEGMAPQIRNKRRSFDAWKGELKIKEIAKYIDKGVPLMWCLFSTDKFNETANKRTKERKDIADWAAWKTKVTGESAGNSLPKDKESGHVVLIIGYNKDTNEIAFSDSWGERYKERWITLPEAEQVSQQYFYVVGF